METTDQYGTPSSQRRLAAAWTALVEDDIDDLGNHDPDKLVQCPFDANHMIRSSRFPYHLIKCRKNHPKLAKQLRTCPYNARHLVHKDSLSRHTETCPSRTCVVAKDEEDTSGIAKWKVPPSTWVNPNMGHEDWDKEADDNAPAFVWGESRVLNNVQEDKPVNTLGQSTRPPKTFPWTGL